MPESKNRLKRPITPMPVLVKDALNQRHLMEAYHARPPYQKNDYLRWIDHAKLDTTKQKRLNQMLDELESGNLYMKMAWKSRTI